MVSPLFRSLCVTVLILLIVAAVVGWQAWRGYQAFVAHPIAVGDEQVVYKVEPGTTLRQVAGDLTKRGWVSNPYNFMALAYLTGQQNALKAGEYGISSGMRPVALLELLTSGRSIQFPVTFVEGTRFRDAVAAIPAAGAFKIELAGLSDEEIMARIGIDDDHPEGWLFPDTYLFPRGTTDTTILKRAHQRMKDVLAEEWAGRSDDLPLETPYEALILASIIEKETAVPEERPSIAGVFVRRLQKGMKLQTDPTVIYGMGDDYDGNIRREDLREATPYNTYVIDGLPPTPIALPGREAIHAALHPAAGDALYFVARGDGSHHFSATLDEHNCAVRHYQLKRPCPSLKEQP
jgi:UPF0755 protein